MKLYIFLAALLLLSVQARAADGVIPTFCTGHDPLKLVMGQGKLVRFDKNATTLFLADPSVADYTIKSPGLLYLLPKQAGETNFIGLGANNEILFNSQIQVKINLTQMFRVIRDVAPNSRLSIKDYGKVLVVKGEVPYDSYLTNVISVLEQFASGMKIHNLATVASPEQVYLKVRVVEVSRTATDQLGLNWQVGYRDSNLHLRTGFQNGAATASAGTGIGSGIMTGQLGFNFNLLLDALSQKGLATILAEPNLTTLSGSEAQFLAGGQFPIPVPQALGVNTIQFQSFGVALNFMPTIVHKDLINLKINTSVSSLSDNGVKIGEFAVPGLSQRSASVTIQLHSGESLAIGGLLQKQMRKFLHKYPGLADLPVLGQLFRSKGYHNDETELVIVVTPYLVNPSSTELSVPTNSFPSHLCYGKQKPFKNGLIIEK